MTTPRIGVVIVAFHASERAARLAAGLEAQGVEARDVVVVDNGSDPEDRAAAEKLWDGAWRHLPNPGFGAAVNAGETALPEGVELLAVLADDVKLGPGTLTGLAAQWHDDPDAGLVGPALLDARDGSVWSHGGTILGRGRNPHHLRPERGHPGPARWLDDAVIMMRRADFRALDGFDERYFLYYEDVDLGLRVTRDLGKTVVCRTDVSASKVPDDHLTLYLDTRNRLRLQRRHHHWAALLLLVGETLARLTVGSVVSRHGAGDRFVQRARGLRDGLRRG